jgi:RNA-binding protein NOB1
MATPPQKQIHSLIVDTGPLIHNTISISTIIQSAEHIFTTPAIISEIRDAATRSRVETTLLPFLTLREPTPASYEFVAQFSKKTGDYPVLSRQDMGILALAYEVDQERKKEEKALASADEEKKDAVIVEEKAEVETSETLTTSKAKGETANPESSSTEPPVGTDPARAPESLEEDMSRLRIASDATQEASPSKEESALSEYDDEDNDGEWITPTNLKQHQAKDNGVSMKESEATQLSSATMTTDYAMQNVLLQLQLSLISPSMQRIKTLRTYIMRCHACFLTTKEMSKQFCPRCGQPTLNRVSCTTNAKGEFKIHLAKNHQWNNRGNKFSVPKPVHGTASGKGIKGGGKAGWGTELVLAEDQKEYQRGIGEQRRAKTRDLMDEDYLPGILTGDRGRAGGRLKVGAGKNINSKKRF